MTVADVIRAAMALTPEERSRVADVLYETDEPNQDQIDAAWASVAARRADELETGAVRMLTREEADEYLDARAAARNASTCASDSIPTPFASWMTRSRGTTRADRAGRAVPR